MFERLSQDPRTHGLVRGLRVLLIDGDIEFRSDMASLLGRHGCLISEFGDAATALVAAEERRPDAVISNVHLPDVSGFELAARLAVLGHTRFPTVLFTEDTSIDPPADARGTVHALLYRPFSAASLLEEVRHAHDSALNLADSESEAESSVSPRFLIIEDNRLDQTLIAVLLRKAGYEGVGRDVVSTLQEGLQLIRTHRYSHMLVNTTLGDHDPVSVVTQVRSACQDTPLLMLADEPDPAMASALVRLGADSFVVKDNAEGRVFRQILDHSTERSTAHLRLLHAVQHDPLTGLSNRRLFRDRLSRDLAKARQRDRNLAFVLIHIEDFDTVTATIGTLRAERLMGLLGQRLDALFPDGSAGYLGSEHFGVVLHPRHAAEPLKAVERLAADLKLTAAQRIKGIRLTIRTGTVLGGTTETDGESLFAAAYEAVEEGAQSGVEHQLFDAELAAAVSRRRVMRRELVTAITREELTLHYQRKIDLRTGTVCGTEALMRWTRRTGERVSPAEFVPLLERTGLISDFGYWALKQACAQAVQWLHQGVDLGSIAVNLSARQFRDTDLVTQVSTVLAESGLAPEYLQLELTESSLVGDVAASAAVMQELRSLGVSLALDDFGTGYSSLGYLRSLPFQVLKVDRSFVRDIETDLTARALANGIVALGKALGLSVVAEGLETLGQLSLLKNMGCDVGQGYLLGRPVPAAEVDSTPQKASLELAAEQ